MAALTVLFGESGGSEGAGLLMSEYATEAVVSKASLPWRSGEGESQAVMGDLVNWAAAISKDAARMEMGAPGGQGSGWLPAVDTMVSFEWEGDGMLVRVIISGSFASKKNTDRISAAAKRAAKTAAELLAEKGVLAVVTDSRPTAALQKALLEKDVLDASLKPGSGKRRVLKGP